MLVGHAGSTFWPVFQRFELTHEGPDPLDAWSQSVGDAIATQLDCAALYPFEKPWWPFQNWIARAEGLRPSPLGILIHPEYGLWHGYRLAFAFREALPIPAPRSHPHACDNCMDKPCIAACPVDAIAEEGFKRDDLPPASGFHGRPGRLHESRLLFAKRLSGGCPIPLQSRTAAFPHGCLGFELGVGGQSGAPSAPALAPWSCGCVLGDLVAHWANLLDDFIHGRGLLFFVRVNCFAHGHQVVAGGSTASADDFCARINRKACIFGHQRWRARIVDLRAAEFRECRNCP